MVATNDDFLGSGWGFDFAAGGVTADARGAVFESRGEDKIRQSLWILLSTAPGERVARPDFGCGIHDYVFATRTASTIGEIQNAVTEAINQWEPRVSLISVNARLHPSDALGILIDIQYRIRATNAAANLVYPFYLST